jgi:hypothetical protein
MKNKTLIALAAGILGVAATFATQGAWAEDQRFSLSTAFDNSSDQYGAGPWEFKLTVPPGIAGTTSAVPKVGSISTTGVASNPQFGLADTEAAASYNLYPGSASSPEINLTGKVKVNMADRSSVFGLKQNDYAAQMDVYQNLDKFTAKGSLGSKVLGSQTGITLTPLLYGSFGGVYQFTKQTSTGIDMSLSQNPDASGITQQEVSAYVNYKLDKNFKARGYLLREYSNGNQNNILGGQVYYGF